MPQEIIDSHELQTITLDYRRECQHDDVVDSLTSPESAIDNAVSGLQGTNGSPVAARDENDCLQFLHLLRLSNNGSEINRGRTEWRKKPAKRWTFANLPCFNVARHSSLLLCLRSPSCNSMLFVCSEDFVWSFWVFCFGQEDWCLCFLWDQYHTFVEVSFPFIFFFYWLLLWQ